MNQEQIQYISKRMRNDCEGQGRGEWLVIKRNSKYEAIHIDKFLVILENELNDNKMEVLYRAYGKEYTSWDLVNWIHSGHLQRLAN